MTAGTLVTVAGLPGLWVVTGQATYVDDDGRVVEHDWLRVVQDDEEVWVEPDAVVPCVVNVHPLTELPESA